MTPCVVVALQIASAPSRQIRLPAMAAFLT